MQEENKHLTPEQARHLTVHGVNQNEDGTYSWKFDNYVRACSPYDMTIAKSRSCGAGSLSDAARLWEGELGAHPEEDGRLQISRTQASSRSRAPGIGCITTSSTSFSACCANSSEALLTLAAPKPVTPLCRRHRRALARRRGSV